MNIVEKIPHALPLQKGGTHKSFYSSLLKNSKKMPLSQRACPACPVHSFGKLCRRGDRGGLKEHQDRYHAAPGDEYLHRYGDKSVPDRLQKFQYYPVELTRPLHIHMMACTFNNDFFRIGDFCLKGVRHSENIGDVMIAYDN